jgi:hypothetical protein
MEITRILDHGIYPRKAVTEARQAFRDHCTFQVSPLGGERVRLSISVKAAHTQNAREVMLEFLNYVLDRAAQIYLDSR